MSTLNAQAEQSLITCQVQQPQWLGGWGNHGGKSSPTNGAILDECRQSAALFSLVRPKRASSGSSPSQGVIAVQGQIRRTKSSQGVPTAHAGRPAALFSLVRPERASVRFSLSTRRALSGILQGFGELGWPGVTEDISSSQPETQGELYAMVCLIP